MQSKRPNIEEIADLALLEEWYNLYLKDPHALDSSWKEYFDSLEKVSPPSKIIPAEAPSQIEFYRRFGHLYAQVNPIALKPTQKPPQVEDPKLQAMQKIYCGPVGFECTSLSNPDLEKWLQSEIENSFFQATFSEEDKRTMFQALNRSELFETFLQKKYPGQKRFSLEGAETLIPMLTLFLKQCHEDEVIEVLIGMAHRGRLNVLASILNKSYREIFAEFDESTEHDTMEGMGDVKYHKGYQGDSDKIKLTLSPNPSHLESVNCVLEGLARAKQELTNDQGRNKIIPLLIHGDASVSGQGVVYETLQLSKLPGYTTGGTIHIVVNNQIGFTTIQSDLRSTPNCTDIAKAFGMPVFRVNAEDPENCVKAMLLAGRIRREFHEDVFIDLICYRKYGHNESDEPAFTQPHEYKLIKSKQPIRELFRDHLLKQGVVSTESITQLEEEFQQGLQKEHALLKEEPPKSSFHRLTSNLFEPCKTGVALEEIRKAAEHFSIIPDKFSMHPKVENLVKERLKMARGEQPIDWGMGEHLAFATLLLQGVSIRLAGQDSCRGTFSQRHALWVDQNVEQDYYPLAHLEEDQGTFEVVNSPLSEMGVLAFEYGYSVANPDALTIWEAQFGDFCNGAQIIIDQYLAGGEQKWAQTSSLVLFLPHGYEGQGPEHSSGRLERFLSLAGHDNLIIANPTTPAQFFHLLRRQKLKPLMKPLVVFTPKGLLRHPLCTSSLDDLVSGAFLEIYDDMNRPKNPKTLVFCTGHVYIDLIQQRTKLKKENDFAIVRVEQLYPLHQEALKSILKSYTTVEKYVWAQEEPKNMGAWHYILPELQSLLPEGKELCYAGRERSASPATGSHRRHEQEFDSFIKQVFTT